MDDNDDDFKEKESFTDQEQTNSNNPEENDLIDKDLDAKLSVKTVESASMAEEDPNLTDELQQEKLDQEPSKGEPEPRVIEKREKVSLENVSLDVRFEMNRIQTTLAELKNFEAGYIFDFDLNPDTVYLTVAGKTIGTGQLVEVGQKVGVRITEIYK